MKKLIALTGASLIILAPSLALAQTPYDIRANAQVQANASTTTQKPRPYAPPLGPAIKNLASTTGAQWKGTASTTREAVRAKVDAIHALIAKHKDAMRERADAAKEKAKARFGENVEKLVVNISERLASTSAKLGALADRADARIEELKDQGFEMASSTMLLEKARGDLAVANEKITAVNAALEVAMSSTTPKGEIGAIRTAVRAAQEALALVKTDLVQTLRAIKVESGATSTVSI